MVKHIKVAIVIPAFNEALTIYEMVNSIKSYGVPIIVDDGSTDLTSDIASKAGALTITHEKNLGYEAALNTGFKAAENLHCDAIITIDADKQHNPMLIPKFIEALNDGYDLIIGERNEFQRFGEYIFSFYTTFMYGVKDPLCGLKAYKADLYKSYGCFDKNKLIGSELMLFAIKRGMKYKQIKFQVCRRNGDSRFGDLITGNKKILFALIKILFLKQLA